MTAPLVDTTFVTLRRPLDGPPSFLLLEVVVLASGILGLVHARRAFRAGDRGPLLTWLTIFVYGLVMELVSYNTVDNFTHGQFTVMLYHHKLPLYITTVYPTLLYTAITTARRFGPSLRAEPFLAGLFIVAMDVPFDVLGPPAGWWRWADGDPNIAYHWLGVPVTSFYWHFAFGGLLAALTRATTPYVRGPAGFLLALPAALVTIVLGVVSFIPFHVLKARGVADGTIVAGLLAIGAAVALLARKERPQGRDALLLAVPVLFYGAHLAVAVAFAAERAPGAFTRLLVVAAETVLAAAAHAAAHRARAG